MEALGDLTSRRRTAISVALASVVGLLLLLPGLVLQGSLVLPWFVPACDIAAILSMATTVVLGSLDAQLREDTRSLPVVAIATTAGILWLAHFVVFPGVIPALTWPSFDDMTVWLFDIISLATPSMLAIALTRGGRHTDNPGRSIRRSIGLGVIGGLAGVLLAFLLAASSLDAVNGNTFLAISSLVGVVALAPTATAMLLYLQGYRGDERVITGILAAIVLCLFSSVALIFNHVRYTPIWYSLHVLEFLPFAALLFGQLSLYERSVRAERESERRARLTARRLQIGVDVAADLAASLEPREVTRRLIQHALAAAAADQGSLCRVTSGQVMIEDSRQANGQEYLRVGRSWPLQGRRLLEQVVETRQAAEGSMPDLSPFPPAVDERLGDIRRVAAVPVELGTEVAGVLVLTRRRPQPFSHEELATLQQIGNIAMLALRNARLYATAEEASRSKSLFLNMAAHELRTPLTVLAGYISLLMDGSLGPPSESWRRTIGTLQAKTGELSNLVNGILVAARLEAGRVALRLERLDVATVVTAASERLKPSADLRGASIHLSLPTQPIAVTGDLESLARVLDNLLNNALVYSDGPPWIRVSAVAADGFASITVEDRGLGIPPDMHERIFERLVRVDRPSLGFPPGTGLGLFISRTLAEQMGGRLTLERSQPGVGSAFILQLPLAPAAPRPKNSPSGSLTGSASGSG